MGSTASAVGRMTLETSPPDFHPVAIIGVAPRLVGLGAAVGEGANPRWRGICLELCGCCRPLLARLQGGGTRCRESSVGGAADAPRGARLDDRVLGSTALRLAGLVAARIGINVHDILSGQARVGCCYVIIYTAYHQA